MREVSSAARTWAGSFDEGIVGMKMTDLVVRDPYGEEPELTLPLRELVCSELRYVLRADAAARAGASPATRNYHFVEDADHDEPGDPDTGEELRHAAARLDQLTSTAELYGRGLYRGWPPEAANALQEASRVSALLADLVSHITEPVTENLRKGSVVALPAAGATDIPNQAAAAAAHSAAAEKIAGLLEDAGAKLHELSGQIGQLQHTTSAYPGASQHDGPTLDTEAVLDWRMQGCANQSRFHVRVFRPAGELPVVVMGQMGDNHSQSITNAVEEVAAVVAELLLGGAAHDTVRWVQLYPPGRFGGPHSEAGLIQAVRFDEPYGSPRWGHRTHDELEELAGGAVRSWHSSDYTIPAMTQRGIPVLHPETKRYRPRRNEPETDTSAPAPAPPPDPNSEPPRKNGRWWRRRRDQ